MPQNDTQVISCHVSYVYFIKVFGWPQCSPEMYYFDFHILWILIWRIFFFSFHGFVHKASKAEDNQAQMQHFGRSLLLLHPLCQRKWLPRAGPSCSLVLWSHLSTSAAIPDVIATAIESSLDISHPLVPFAIYWVSSMKDWGRSPLSASLRERLIRFRRRSASVTGPIDL